MNTFTKHLGKLMYLHFIIFLKKIYFHNPYMKLNQDLSIFGYMHDFWTISTATMMYTRSQNYTNMVVGEHGIQTFEVVIVMLLSIDVTFQSRSNYTNVLSAYVSAIFLHGYFIKQACKSHFIPNLENTKNLGLISLDSPCINHLFGRVRMQRQSQRIAPPSIWSMF